MGQLAFDFSGVTAIVTGGASGIGRAIATEFGDAGATVLIGDVRRSPKDVDASVPTHERIEDRGGTAEFHEVDATDDAQIRSLVDAAGDHGGVDVMVNHVGGSLGVSLQDVTPEQYEHGMALNVKGTLFGSQAAARDMIERETGGSIVNTASIRSRFAARGHILYGPGKGAVKMLTRVSALELAEFGIRVNAVAPGPIATETVPGRTERIDDVVAGGDYTKEIPMGRAGTPEEVADAALFLACDRASYITGELLHVDGGFQVV